MGDVRTAQLRTNGSMVTTCDRADRSHSARIALAWVAPLLLATLFATIAQAQGINPYVNFESPQGHPIEVFSLAETDVIAVCNTPNNTIELYSPDENLSNRFLGSIKVGLEPVTVRYNERNGFLYSVNFLGDSVSIVHVSIRNGQPTLTMVDTEEVGDEPIDIAFYPRTVGDVTRETIITTHMSPDAFRWLDAWTLDPVIPGTNYHEAAVDVDTVGQGLPEDIVTRAAKEPRAVRVVGDQLMILPLKGGENNATHIVPDLDLYCDDLRNPFVNPVRVEGIGTTGFNMDLDSSEVLYIVGGEALNKELLGEPTVAGAPTGFFKSMFYRIEGPCSGNPQIRRRDVNLEPALQPVPFGFSGPIFEHDPLVTRPVKKADALSMLTDVVVYDTGSDVPKVFFTALSNDRVGIIEPDPNQPDENRWPIERVNIAPINGKPLAGPNGLALKLARGVQGDPGDRVYVLNHFDNSVSTIDPTDNSLLPGLRFSLQNDPRPSYLHDGRQFLYDSKLSGNHFVSCASCHTYGRTDGLGWDLGVPGDPPVEIPEHLLDAIGDHVWFAEKGVLITQSLQGLLNFELDPMDQDFTTNAPYHWRGDRETFLDFRGAFETLLDGPELDPLDMVKFETFVNTIHYPPNPKQPRDRVASGDFGSGDDLDNDGSTGGQRGLKFFHLEPVVQGRSCVFCHTLPEGSNNRLTDAGLPLETAAMRGLYQKEAKREEDGYTDLFAASYTGFEGLVHNGRRGNSNTQLVNHVATINGFNFHFFSDSICGQAFSVCPDLQDLNQFGHEIDWGMGPLVGCPMTIDTSNRDDAYSGSPSQGCDAACSDTASTLDCMEEQAGQANSGVAVHLWDQGVQSGYWYDPIRDRYIDEPGGQEFTRDDLLDVVGGRDRVLFQAVPLGSERRVAAIDGVPGGPIDGVDPAGVNLMPMTPGTFYERVPEMSQMIANFDNTTINGIWIHTLRLYQWGLIIDGALEGGFGTGTELRHDAPRRFQVSGKDLRHGASLVLAMQDDPSGGPPDPGLGLEQFDTREIVLPLYATDEVEPLSGHPIWQTAAELDPFAYYTLMLGGPHAPGVQAAFDDQEPFTFPMEIPAEDKPTPGNFDPLAWNWIHATVVNADGTASGGEWFRLRID